MQSGLPINMPKFGIHIDDYVWLGQSVTIGTDAVVGKKEFMESSIIARIPDKTIKMGINLDKQRNT